MKSFMRFAYGFLAGLVILQAIACEWRVVLCAVLALVMLRLVTQGSDE